MDILITQALLATIFFLTWYRQKIANNPLFHAQVQNLDILIWLLAGITFFLIGHLVQQATPIK